MRTPESVRTGAVSRPSLSPVRYPVVLHHLQAMTDGTGMVQHGVGGVPDLATGYTTDDNARAFLATVRLWRAMPERRAEFEPLLRRYLAFLSWTQHRDGENIGWFVNFVSYDRRFLDERGTEDCLGRCLWALGEAISGPLPPACALPVRALWSRALNRLVDVRSPRALAYALLGLCHAAHGDTNLIHACADPLLRGFRTYAEDGWEWLEPYLTYDNARLVEALWRVAQITGNSEYREVAEKMLAFLTTHSFINGNLEPIGNRGWMRRDGKRALFDQQTIEAGAYAELYCLVGDSERAGVALEWFYGRNAHLLPLYDPDTGGCYDGLTMPMV